ncbi:MAG: hypothetical protein ACXWJO_12705, partial [Xanthobacteraceae bacterium]
RAKKAQRRKLQVVEKRRADASETSLPARVLRVAHAPIQQCLLTESLFEIEFQPVEGEILDMYLDKTDAASPLVPVNPSYARKLLRDLAAWSQSIGFTPHRDFAAVEPLFGEVDPNASDAVFQFGRDGKPLYIPGPSESALQVRRRIEHLRKTLGDGGFGLETAA